MEILLYLFIGLLLSISMFQQEDLSHLDELEQSALVICVILGWVPFIVGILMWSLFIYVGNRFYFIIHAIYNYKDLRFLTNWLYKLIKYLKK